MSWLSTGWLTVHCLTGNPTAECDVRHKLTNAVLCSSAFVVAWNETENALQPSSM